MSSPTSSDAHSPDTRMQGIITAIRSCYDPEIPVNVYDLGLIYGIDIDPESSDVTIRMTLTSPACPVAGSLPNEVAMKVEMVPGVGEAFVELVWDPPWSPDLLSEEVRLQLNL